MTDSFLEKTSAKRRKAEQAAEHAAMRKNIEDTLRNTPEAIMEAEKRMRELKATHEANSPESRAILSENHEAFTKFVQEWQGPASEANEAKVAFLERFQYVEHLKSLITPEFVDRLASSQSQEIASAFASIKPENFAEIIKGRLFQLAMEHPAEFDVLANSIQTFEIIKQSERYRKADKEAESIEKRYRVTGKTREKLLAIVNDPAISEEEKQEAFLEHVHRTRWLTSGFKKFAASGAAFLEAKTAKLDKELHDSHASISALSLNLEALSEKVSRLRAQSHEMGAEDGHPILAELAEAQDELEQARKTYASGAAKHNAKINLRKHLEGLREFMEKTASEKKLKKEADFLSRAVPVMEQHLALVNRYIDDIGGTMKAAVDIDSKIREGITKALVDEAQEETPEPTPEPRRASTATPKRKPPASRIAALSELFPAPSPADTAKLEEHLQAIFPSKAALQVEFERYVLQKKAEHNEAVGQGKAEEGKHKTRERLKKEFIRFAATRVQNAYRRRTSEDTALSRQASLKLIERRIRPLLP